MEYYIVYSTETGEIWSRNSGPDGAAALISPQEGRATMLVPYEIWDSTPLDLDALKGLAEKMVDGQAEAFRMQFISPGDGQMLTYTYKANEALAYLADDTAPVPFLTAEATARGMTVLELAQEVATMVAEWTFIGSRIEGLRMGAKTALANAENLADVHQAITIDWAAELMEEP